MKIGPRHGLEADLRHDRHRRTCDGHSRPSETIAVVGHPRSVGELAPPLELASHGSDLQRLPTLHLGGGGTDLLIYIISEACASMY